MTKNILKKINNITNFGCFKNFKASSDLKEFQKYNLIWGLNGTGKTTLSRFFDCLNSGNIKDFNPNEYENLIEFTTLNEEDNTSKKYKSFKNNPFIHKIKIFNSDFVRLNLSLDNTNAYTNTITYNIGEVSKDIKQKINDLEIKLKSFYSNNDITKKLIIDEQIENSKKSLEDKSSAIASDIRDELGIDNSQSYNRVAFLHNFDEVCLTEKPNISEIEKNNAVKKYRQPSRNAINIKLQIIINNDELKSIQDLLNSEIKRKTKVSDELVKWLEQGLKIKNSDNCPFCGTNVAQDWELRHHEILELLKKDDSYIQFENNLINWHNTLSERKQQINLTPFNNLRTTDFIVEMEDNVLNDYKNICRYYLSAIDAIIEKIQQKNINKDNIYDISNYEININNYSTMISSFNKIIEDNNKSVSTLEQDKKEAKETVIKYYVSSNYNDITEINEKIKELENNKTTVYKEVNDIKEELKDLQLQLSSQSLPIKEIEKYINIVFGYEKFNLELNKDSNSYIIKRDGNKVAQNLSEGEKTVISFAYFLATLKSEKFNLGESIIIIDDPVSSLDQQYLFNLLNLLMEIFSSPKSFAQIFMMTHNFYFFKKINAILQNKENSINKNNNSKECSTEKEKVTLFEVFQICRDESSYIINANKYLRNFQSEYSYLIKYLKDIMKKEDDEISCIPIGNSIRKVLEIFLAFRCPKEKTIYSQYKNVTKDWDDVAKGQFMYLQDIANATSHTEGCADLDALEDFKVFVGKKEVKQLFDFIQKVDNEHYTQLPN